MLNSVCFYKVADTGDLSKLQEIQYVEKRKVNVVKLHPLCAVSIGETKHFPIFLLQTNSARESAYSIAQPNQLCCNGIKYRNIVKGTVHLENHRSSKSYDIFICTKPMYC